MIWTMLEMFRKILEEVQEVDQALQITIKPPQVRTKTEVCKLIREVLKAREELVLVRFIFEVYTYIIAKRKCKLIINLLSSTNLIKFLFFHRINWKKRKSDGKQKLRIKWDGRGGRSQRRPRILQGFQFCLSKGSFYIHAKLWY